LPVAFPTVYVLDGKMCLNKWTNIYSEQYFVKVDGYLETHAWPLRTSLMVIPLRDWLVFGPEWVSSCGDSRLLASRVKTSAEVNGIARKGGACRQ